MGSCFLLLKNTTGTASVNSMLSAVNPYLTFLGRQDCRVRVIRRQRQLFSSTERELTRQEYQRLVTAAQERQKLQLLLQTICATGIRVSEHRFITVEAAKSGAAEVRCKGKGHRPSGGYSGHASINATGHKHNAVVTAPTCEAEGYTTYTCVSCGEVLTAQEETSALGHSYISYEKNGKGLETAACANNGCDMTHTQVDASYTQGPVEIDPEVSEDQTAEMLSWQDMKGELTTENYTWRGREKLLDFPGLRPLNA